MTATDAGRDAPIRFAVVIPLYNKRPHIARALSSALDQSYPATEIIVVDDASTDGGLEIVHGFDDPRLKILHRTEPGPGGYAARNLAIKHARADWVAFLDADDVWHASHLEDMAKAIAACPGRVGCVFTRFEVIDAAGRRPYHHSARLRPGVALPLTSIIEAWLETQRCPFWTGASAFRRELLVEAGLFPAGRATRGGDKDMWLRAAAREQAVFAEQSSAEFHQETVNRVTRSARHAALPVLVETIASLMAGASPDERALLKRLSNQEIVLYAHYSAGGGTPFDLSFFRALYPPRVRDTIKLAGYWFLSLLFMARRPRA